VDFVLRQGKRLIAVEAKAGERFKPEMLKGLKAIRELPGVRRRILVYGGRDTWTTDEGIEVLSPEAFVRATRTAL
jgi:predicted AAA+ superfamily ATPase